MISNNYGDLVIRLLLDDKVFSDKYIEYITDDGFNSEQRELLTIIKNYKSKYHNSISNTVLLKEIDNYDDEIKKTLRSKLISISTIELDALEWTRDNILKEVKYQRVKAVILQSPQLIKSNIDDIRSLMNEAFDFTLDINNGIRYVEEIEERYKKGELVRKGLIPLPWDWLNNVTDGGIGQGELMLAAAPPGIGKTSFLMQVGKHAIKNGKNILHISLELSQEYVAKRYDTALTSVIGKELFINQKSVIDSIRSQAKGELFIFSFPTKSITLDTIYSLVREKKNEGIEIHGVILDYLDLFKVNGNNNKKDHELLGELTLEARKLAGELMLPVFSASQVNRSGDNEADIKGDNISGSYEKLMIADFVPAIMRNDFEKINNFARGKIIKNRFGPDGLTFPMRMNQSTMKMDLYDPQSDEGKTLMSEIKSGDVVVKREKATKSLEVIKGKYTT